MRYTASIVFICFMCCFSSVVIAQPQGTLIYHEYTSYDAKDSELFMYDLATDTLTCLNDAFEGVYHTMNAHFNRHGNCITFMGLVHNGYEEEWDIFIYNLETQELKNLTEGNRLRDEDPKFSPVDDTIVFKQGYWDTKRDRMVYNIKMLDIHTQELTSLTQDLAEDSMPYFSTDGSLVYYVRGAGANSQIRCVAIDAPKQSSLIYKERGVFSYYPVVFNHTLYFSKWVSGTNTSDCILKFNTVNGTLLNLPFNDPDYNFSDPCMISDEWLVLSSTKASTGSGYELYFANQQTGMIYPLSLLNPKINNTKHQLSPVFKF